MTPRRGEAMARPPPRSRRLADPEDIITVERVISAPPAKIFELLAEPRGHRMIDGSGSVRDPKNTPPRLSLGAKFDMAMKLLSTLGAG